MSEFPCTIDLGNGNRFVGNLVGDIITEPGPPPIPPPPSGDIFYADDDRKNPSGDSWLIQPNTWDVSNDIFIRTVNPWYQAGAGYECVSVCGQDDVRAGFKAVLISPDLCLMGSHNNSNNGQTWDLEHVMGLFPSGSSDYKWMDGMGEVHTRKMIKAVLVRNNNNGNTLVCRLNEPIHDIEPAPILTDAFQKYTSQPFEVVTIDGGGGLSVGDMTREGVNHRCNKANNYWHPGTGGQDSHSPTLVPISPDRDITPALAGIWNWQTNANSKYGGFCGAFESEFAPGIAAMDARLPVTVSEQPTFVNQMDYKEI